MARDGHWHSQNTTGFGPGECEDAVANRVDDAAKYLAPSSNSKPIAPSNANVKRPRAVTGNSRKPDRTKKARKLGENDENKENAVKALTSSPSAAAAVDADEILSSKSTRWTDDEKSMFFEWLLGADAEEENRYFKAHRKDPMTVYKKV